MVENKEMQISSADPARKRKYKESFCPEELTHKFSSKLDLYTYMSEYRKCDLPTLTTIV